jgi:iron complex transport system ATP-binding protein
MTERFLDVQNVTWAPRKRDPLLLRSTSFHLNCGAVMGLVGPNGAGKTTLLRLLYGYNRPLSGDILLEGDSLCKMAPRSLARKVAVVLQEQPSDFALTVREIVALGRVPHRLGFSTPGQRDAEIVENALVRLQLQNLSHRTLATLSGGERQRVMVARAIAQQPQLLILDEPTNHLDIRHQLEVLQLIRDLNLTIVTSLHDLNLAADVCDVILVLKDGQPQGFGTPERVLTDSLVSETFKIRARREELSLSQKEHLTFRL